MQISSLKKILESEEELIQFIDQDLIELSEYLCNCDSQTLYKDRDDIYNIIASNQSKISRIKIDINTIKFIYLLLEISQRLGHRSNFLYLYKIIKDNNYDPGSRIEASAKYYAFGNDSIKLISEFENIHDYLQVALTEEDDSEKLIYTCFFNYYVYLVIHFSRYNPEVIIEFAFKVNTVLATYPESFLHHPIINRMLEIDVENIEKAIDLLNIELNQFSTILSINNYKQELVEIEYGTEYTEAINKEMNINYDTFLMISKILYKKNKNEDIWQSLDRGIAILDKEIQLLGYLHSYGEMHKEKMKTAISYFIDIEKINNINVYDWGCGQGLGSIYFCDELKKINKLSSVKNINLIEPSSIAIKRAAFNLSKLISIRNLTLFNTDLNGFIQSAKGDKVNIKIHIFSNILDIENFSIKNLVSFLSNDFSGLNYFVCTSPKLPQPKNFRFHYFIDEFKKFSTFELLGSVSQGKYEWRNDKSWTREVCVFKVQL